jgi:hypothetical protein
VPPLGMDMLSILKFLFIFCIRFLIHLWGCRFEVAVWVVRKVAQSSR